MFKVKRISIDIRLYCCYYYYFCSFNCVEQIQVRKTDQKIISILLFIRLIHLSFHAATKTKAESLWIMDDEDTLLLRAKEERDRIFERYDRGRDTDNPIEPWEDPGFEVYHRTDKYAFCSLSLSRSQVITSETA